MLGEEVPTCRRKVNTQGQVWWWGKYCFILQAPPPPPPSKINVSSQGTQMVVAQLWPRKWWWLIDRGRWGSDPEQRAWVQHQHPQQLMLLDVKDMEINQQHCWRFAGWCSYIIEQYYCISAIINTMLAVQLDGLIDYYWKTSVAMQDSRAVGFLLLCWNRMLYF